MLDVESPKLPEQVHLEYRETLRELHLMEQEREVWEVEELISCYLHSRVSRARKLELRLVSTWAARGRTALSLSFIEDLSFR